MTAATAYVLVIGMNLNVRPLTRSAVAAILPARTMRDDDALKTNHVQPAEMQTTRTFMTTLGGVLMPTAAMIGSRHSGHLGRSSSKNGPAKPASPPRP